MKKYRFLLLILGLSINSACYGQDSNMQELIGLWNVDRVEVGNNQLTPIAKWTEFSRDSIFKSGNGWLQHSSGKYFYDPKSKSIEMIDKLGIKDEFGPFTISIEGDQMHWERMEEGEKVKVLLSRIDEMPRGPQDYLVGMWELQEIHELETNTTTTKNDSNNSEHLYLRWDREYRKWVGKKRSRGYWHMNAHRPILNIISEEINSYEIKQIDEFKLILKGKNEQSKEVELTYSRKDSFPKP